jgi:Bacterial Ig domain/Fibronectin type III domain
MKCKAKGFEIRRKAFLLFLLGGVAALWQMSALATQSVTLGWEPSADTNVVGYNIYYGTTSHVYTNKVSFGNVTNATIVGLSAGTTYFFAATTDDGSGLESGFSNEASYAVPLVAVNQAPTLDLMGDLDLDENAAGQTVALTGISSGAPNENQKLTVTATSTRPSLTGNPTVSYTSPNATGTLAFKPVADASGTAIITVTVNDGTKSVAHAFTVTINAVNQPPTLNAVGNVSVNENAAAKTITLSGITSGAPNEKQKLTLTAVSGNPSLIPNPSVSYASPNTTGLLTFKPVANATGSTTLTLTLNDGATTNNITTKTFTVSVNVFNQPPTLNVLGNVSVNENAATKTIAISGITSGAANEVQTLTVTATSSNPSLIPNPSVNYTSPNQTGVLKLAPVTYASGKAVITVTVNDGGLTNNLVKRTFTVIVNPVNQAPTLDLMGDLDLDENAAGQTVALTGISSGAPNENQKLTVTATSTRPSLTGNPTVSYTSPNATGTLAFKPVADASGTAIITVTVNDGTKSVAHAFTVTINAVNQPPTLNAVGNVSVNENAAAKTITLSGITSGAPNEKQKLTLTAVSGNPSLIPNPSVSYASPNTTGLLTFKPVANATGSTTLTLTLNDGATTNNITTKTFTVSVINTNAVSSISSTSNLRNNVTIEPPPAATLTQATYENGQYGFNVSDASGSQYVIQASTNLVDWVSVETNTAPFTFVDVSAGQFSQRFYRAVLQQ